MHRTEPPVIYLVQRRGARLVVGAVYTTYFRELGSRISFGHKGHAAIVDQTGRVLAHPLESWENEARDISGVSAVQRMLRGESGVERFYSPALKGDMIAGFTGIEGPGWGVMVPQPMAEFQETAAQVSSSAKLVLLIGVMAALALAILISGWFARPVNAVASVARRMAGGDISARVGDRLLSQPLSEIRSLGTAFNQMADQIEDAQTEEISARVEG